MAIGILTVAIAAAVVYKTGLIGRLRRSTAVPPRERLVDSLAESGESETLLNRPRNASRSTATSTPERSTSAATPSPPSLSPVPNNSSAPDGHFHASNSSDPTMQSPPSISPAPTEILLGGLTYSIAAPSVVASLDPFENVDLTK